MNSVDHLQLLNIIQQSKKEAIEKNERIVQDWKIVKTEYEKINEALETIPNNLSLQVLVPIGTKALMRGKIVHTNEIMVCLGENYFVKQSAKGAQEICNRRITKIDKMIEDLDKEHRYFTSQQDAKIKEAFVTDEITKEIFEPYDEEQEKKWRVQHRQKVKEYKQNLAQLKKNTTKIETEDDIMKRLDDLALQEELEEELARLSASEDEESETDDEDDSTDNENSEEESSENESSLDEPEEKLSNQSTENENSKNNRIIKQVSFSEIDNIKRFEDIREENEQDEEEEDTHIYFQHTPSEKPIEKAINNTNDIQSPSDLYLYNKNKFTPKSILKVSTSEKISELPLHNGNSTEDEEHFDNYVHLSQRKVSDTLTMGDIKEKNLNEETKIKESTEIRPVSRFKKTRQNVLKK